MTWVLFVLGAVLSWGAYGVLLHQGQVQLGNPLEGIGANVPNPEQLQEHLLELTAAIGLALREAVE